MDESWRAALGAEFNKPYMRKLQEFLSTEWQQHSIYPPQPLIFRWVTCHTKHHPRLWLHDHILPLWIKVGLSVLLAWTCVHVISRRWQYPDEAMQ